MKHGSHMNGIGRQLILLYATMMCAVSLYAQEAPSAVRDHENILSKKEKATLEQVIAYQLAFYNRLFPDKPYNALTVGVLVIKNYAHFIAYQAEIGKTIYMHSPGFYSPLRKEIVVYKDAGGNKFLPICYHELSHHILIERMPRPPSWLNEGLATYLENIIITSKGITAEPKPYYLSRVKTMIALKDLDLRDFITWDPRKFAETSFSHDSYGYALAHCMIHLLMKDEAAAFALIRAIDGGKTPFEAFDLHYPGGFEQFEKDFLTIYTS